MLRLRIGACAIFALSLAFGSSIARAQTTSGTWTTAGNGTWSTTSNWSGGTVANGAGALANFGTVNLTANATITLDTNRTIGRLIFGDTGWTSSTSLFNWTLQSGTLTLDNTGGTGGNPPSITINTGTTTISSVLAGSNGLSLAMPWSNYDTTRGTTSAQANDSARQTSGGLTFTGSNTLSGSLGVNGGTVTLGGVNGSFASVTSLSVTGNGTFINGDATAATNNGITNRIGNGTATLSLGGSSGAGTYTSAFAASGTTSQTFASLTINAGQNTLNTANTAAGANNLIFTGGTNGAGYVRNVNGIVNVVPAAGFNPQFTNAPTAAGGSSVSGSGGNAILVGAVLNRTDFISATSGALVAATYTTNGATSLTDGANINITGGNTALTGSTTLSINSLKFTDNAARTLNLGAGSALTIASGGILTGSAVATNGNTITGGSITSGQGDLWIYANGSTLGNPRNGNNALTIASQVTGSISVTVSGGLGQSLITQQVVLSNTANNYTGGTFLANGMLGVGSDGALGATNGTVTAVSGVNHISPSASFTFNANRNFVVNAGAALYIADQGQTNTIAGNLSGGGQFGVGYVSTGQRLILTGSNSNFTGQYMVNGYLNATEGTSLSSNANLMFTGRTFANIGLLETSGTFSRSLGSGPGQVQWQNDSQYGSGGFAAVGGALKVNLGGSAAPSQVTWGSGYFLANGGNLLQLQDNNSTAAVEFQNPIALNGGLRQIAANNATYAATLSGVISGNASSGIRSVGAGLLILTGSNTYQGRTSIENGTLSVATIGSVSGTGNLGAPTTAANGTIDLGSGGGNGANNAGLTYTGSGETSDRVLNMLATIGQITLTQSGTGLLKFTSNVTSGAMRPTDMSTALILAGSTSGTGEISGIIADTTMTGTVTVAASTGATTLTIPAGSLSVNAGWQRANILVSGSGIAPGSRWTGFNQTTNVGTLNVATTADIAANQAITLTGVNSIQKTGTGTWVLSGNNTYTGPTTVSAGVLSVSSLANGGSSSNIGASTNAAGNLVLGGGSLQYTGATVTTDRAFTLTASTTSTIDVSTAGTTLAFTGSTTATTGALTKAGAGTLALAGAAAYTGATAINAGTLQIGNGSTTGGLSSSSAISIASGATLAFRRTDNYGGNFANTITGSGGVTLLSGSLTFSTAKTYTGQTTVNGGVLAAGIANAFGSSAALAVNSGTVNLAGFSQSAGALSGSAGTLITTNNAAGTATLTTTFASGTSTFAGSIADNGSGLVAFTKAGVGTQVLAGNNAYTGATTISAGQLTITGTTNGSGGITVADTTTAANLVVSGNGRLNAGAGTLSVGSGTGVATATFQDSAVWTGTGSTISVSAGANSRASLTIANSAQLTLNGTAGGSGGNFYVGAGSASGAGGVVQSGGSLTVDRQLMVGTVGAGYYGLSAGTIALTGVGGDNSRFRIATPNAGSVGVFQQSGGAVTFSVGLGLGIVDSPGTVVGGTDANVGYGSYFITAGTLTGTAATAGLINAGSRGGQGDFTVGGSAIVNTNSDGIYLGNGATNGTGILNLLGGSVQASSVATNAGAGKSYVNFAGGTLRPSADNATFMQGLTLATVYGGYTSGGTTYAGGATIDTNGFAVTIGQNLRAPTGSGVAVGSFSTITGLVGAPYVRVVGTGSGATAQAIYDPATGSMTGITVTSPGVGYTGTPTFQIFGGGISGTTTVNATTFATTSGGLTKSGSGTLTLSGTNTYTGQTTVNGGVLAAGIANAFGSSAPLAVNSGTVNLAGFSQSVGALSGSAGTLITTANAAGSALLTTTFASGTSTFAGSIADNVSGTVAFTKAGAGTQILSGSNSYTGDTSINAGTLEIASTGRLGGGTYAGAITNNGAFVYSGTNAQTLSGLITGSGAFTNNAASVLTLSGTMSLSGASNAISNTSNNASGRIDITGQLSTAPGSLLTLTVGATAGSIQLSGASNTIQGEVLVTGGSGAGGSLVWLNTPGVNSLSGATKITVASGNTLRYWSASVGAGTTFDLNGTGNGGRGALSFYDSGTSTLSGAVNLSGNSQILSRNASLTLAGNVTESGGARSLTITADGGGATTQVHTLSGSNSFSGGLTFTGGDIAGFSTRLTAGSPTAFGSGPLALGSLTQATASAVVDLNGQSITVGGLSGGNLANANSFIQSDSGAAVLTVNQTTNDTFSGVIRNGTGSVALTKSGNATLTLAGSNSFTGNTRIGAGTLSITNANGLSNSTVDLNAADSGTVSFSQNSTLGGLTGSRNLDMGTRTLSVGNNGQSTTYSGGMSNGALTKIGAGTLALSGTNTFSGVTSIAAGILSINGTSALAGTSGLTIAGGAGLTYTGGAATFGKPITVTAGSGTGTIRNSGGGLLTLSGTLSKDNSVLRLTGGAFNVTGVITGATPGASDLVVDAASVTLSNTNTYDGPTYVFNSGTLALGVNNAIPNTSVVTLGDATTRGTLVLGSFTDSISQLLFLGSGGTLSLSGDKTAAAQLATAGSLTLGSNANLVLTGAGTTDGLYRLISATSISGSFANANVTGVPSNYKLLYSATGIDLQRNADQSTTFTMTTGTVTRALVNTTVALSGSITNASPAGSANLAVSLSSGGVLSVTGLTSGTSSVAPQTSTSVAGTLNAGATAGTRSWSVINTDNGAIQTTSTASGSIDVVNQRTFTVSNSGTINLGNFLRTAAVTGSATISSTGLNATTANATLGAFSGTSTNGFSLGTNDSTVFNGGSLDQSALYSLSGSAASAGAINGSFTSSVTAELGSIDPVSVALVGTAYDPAKASFESDLTTSLLVYIGEFNQNTGDYSKGFSIYNLFTDPTYTADLTLVSITDLVTQSSSLSIDLSPGLFGNLVAGGSSSWLATLTSGATGSFTNQYQLNFVSSKGGQSLGGPQSMTLTVTGVIVVPEPGAIALAGIGIAAAAWAIRRRRT